VTACYSGTGLHNIDAS